MSLARFIFSFCFLPMMVNWPGTVRARVINPEGAGSGIASFSAAVVNGAPAVVWFETFPPQVRYARATDAGAATWEKPVTLFAGNAYRHLSLCVVDGNPAVCFSDSVAHLLKFTRSTDPAGTAWGQPVTAATGAAFDSLGSLAVVNGRPAACYINELEELMFVRASDAEGMAWEPPVKVDGEGPIHRSSMLLVQGQPAIAYGGMYGIRYIRATDTDGAAWGTSRELMSLTIDRLGIPPSFAIVNGRPAIAAAYHPYPWAVRYIRAADDTGASWGQLVSPGDPYVFNWGDHCSLAEVNGKPAIAYLAGPTLSLQYLAATDSGGAWGQWARPATVDSGGAGSGACLLEVQGRPALVYLDAEGKRLNCVTREGPDPAAPWPAQLVVEATEPVQPLYPPGSLDFGILAVRDPKSTMLRLSNPVTGSSDLIVGSWTIDGPDAAEFSITSLPAGLAVPALAVHPFSITWTPHSEGPKSATLHLHSNADSFPVYDIRLTGQAADVPGALNRAFRPSTGPVNLAVLLPDGKIQTSGPGGLSRFFPDGSSDLAFFSPAFTGSISCMAVQKDGKVVVGGSFTKVDGLHIAGLARLNADGSLDTAFQPGFVSSVSCLAVESDGAILAGGTFIKSAGLSWWRNLARVRADGSLDPSFSPRPDDTVRTLALQDDGKILAGGDFSMISEVSSRRWLQRLTPAGALDSLGAKVESEVWCLALYPDDRILTASGSEISARWLRRLSSGGEDDRSMNYFAEGGIQHLCLQADGKALVCGPFASMDTGPSQGMSMIQRFDDSGSLDWTFAPKVQRLQGDTVNQVLIQPDGKVLIAGFFSRVGGLVQVNLARLHNDPAFSRLLTPAHSTIRWLRSGSAPEVRDVTFDLKTDNTPDWTRLGSAARIPGGWELSGLTLPSSGQLRAQAFAGGSVIEQTASILTPLDSWRVQHFNTSNNTGNAANDADPDHDGLTNFTEFAFGLNPVDRSSNSLPEFKHDGSSFTAGFTRPAGRENILYNAEWSPGMGPGTWTPVPNAASAPAFRFTLPDAGARGFIRFSLTVP